MNRIDRLNAILIQLQSKSRVTLEELEERFEVSRRTIFRDIRSLMDAGVPIGGDAGAGYFVVEGYHLPPVVFNRQEAAALLLGGKLIDKHADRQMKATFQEAMYKVKAVLKYADKDFLERMEHHVDVVPSARNFVEGFPDSHLIEIQNAIAYRKVISISYYSEYNDSTTDRQVEPLGMVYYTGRWHLIGYCRLRKDMRDFRCDRIQRIRLMEETFDPAMYPNYRDFLNEMLTGMDVSPAVVRVTRKVARMIQNQKYYYGFLEQSEVEDQIEMKFSVHSYEYFARWLLMFTTQVSVLSPPELLEKLSSLSLELLEYYHNAKQRIS